MKSIIVRCLETENRNVVEEFKIYHLLKNYAEEKERTAYIGP
jgi:hypothetical protein